MQWWNEFINWLESTEGQRVVTTAIVPFVAILVAGIIAALIGRSSAKRVLAYQDRELKAAAVMSLIGAGRKATIWSSLTSDEQQRLDNQLSEADIRVRLLPINGASAAADWAAHELGAMKKNSANFSFQADQTFVQYRNRLLEWQNKPKRARKLFAFDLEQWRFDDEAAEKKQAEQQQQWAAQQGGTAQTDPTPPTAAYVSPATPIAAPIVPPVPYTTQRQVSSETTEVTASDTSDISTPTPQFSDAETTTDSSNSTAVIPEVAYAPDSEEPRYEANSDVSDGRDDEPASTEENYAPPVNAGTVRQRTDPDRDLDDRGNY